MLTALEERGGASPERALEKEGRPWGLGFSSFEMREGGDRRSFGVSLFQVTGPGTRQLIPNNMSRLCQCKDISALSWWKHVPIPFSLLIPVFLFSFRILLPILLLVFPLPLNLYTRWNVLYFMESCLIVKWIITFWALALPFATSLGSLLWWLRNRLTVKLPLGVFFGRTCKVVWISSLFLPLNNIYKNICLSSLICKCQKFLSWICK